MYVFPVIRTLQILGTCSPSIQRKTNQNLVEPINGGTPLVPQPGFFAIRMFRTVVPCHRAPLRFVGTDFRLRMPATAP